MGIRGPDAMDPQVLGVLAYVITGCLQSKRCGGESCEDWEKVRVSPVSKKGKGNLRN